MASEKTIRSKSLEPLVPVRIIIDKMELPGDIPQIFDDPDNKMNVDMDFQILEVGDYVVSDDCGMERKYKDDFKNSLIGDEKGKIFRQVKDLVTSYKKPILLVECELVDLFTSCNIHPNAMWAVLQAITEMGCSIRFTTSATGTAKYIYRKALEEQTGIKKPFNAHGSKTKRNPTEAQEYIVSSITGVGPSSAIKLLQYFGNIESIFTASVESLSGVPGIGKPTAETIRKTVTEDYKKKA